MRQRTLAFVACTMAAVAALAGCSRSGSPGGSTSTRIAVLMYGNKAEFVQLMERYGKEHPAVTSGEASLTFFDGRYDAAVQNDQAQLAINSQYNAIIVDPMDFKANVDIVTNANAANIPVIVTNARLDTTKATSAVDSDDVLGGYLEAKAALDKAGCKGNVVILEGPKGGSGEIQRGQGNIKAINECPAGAVKVLERNTANWSRAEALDLMQNWLSRHKGDINIVIGQNDEMALGAIEAIKSQGMNVHDFTIVGIDGVSDALRAVKNGDMLATILQDAKGQMQGSIDVALAAVKGPEYKPKADIWNNGVAWDNGKDKHYVIPWTKVTAENAEKVLEMRK
jgi:putative xylitol transport system substrate-binding protein